LGRQKKKDEREERVRRALDKMNYSSVSPNLQKTPSGYEFQGEHDDMLLRLK